MTHVNEAVEDSRRKHVCFFQRQTEDLQSYLWWTKIMGKQMGNLVY